MTNPLGPSPLDPLGPSPLPPLASTSPSMTGVPFKGRLFSFTSPEDRADSRGGPTDSRGRTVSDLFTPPMASPPMASPSLSTYGLPRGSPTPLTEEPRIPSLESLAITVGPKAGSAASSFLERLNSASTRALPRNQGVGVAIGGAGLPPIDMPSPVGLLSPQTTSPSNQARPPRELREGLARLAHIYIDSFHEENSFLTLLLFNILSFNPNLYEDLASAFAEKDVIKKYEALEKILSAAKAVHVAAAAGNKTTIEFYDLALKLCLARRVDVFYFPMKNFLSSPIQRDSFFDGSRPFASSALGQLCDGAFHATTLLAHNLLHVHTVATDFLERLGEADALPVPPNGLTALYPPKTSTVDRIHTILAGHCYFEAIASDKTRVLLYSRTCSFLHDMETAQSNFAQSYNDFLSIVNANMDSITDLRDLLRKAARANPRSPLIIELVLKYYDELLTRRRLWVEHMELILEQGKKLQRDGICLLHLYSYLHGDLSKWESLSRPNLKEELVAYVKTHPKITGPEIKEFLMKLDALTKALEKSGIFLEGLNDSWSAGEDLYRADVMVLYTLCKRGLIQHKKTPHPLGSLAFNFGGVKGTSILVEDCYGNKTRIVFEMAEPHHKAAEAPAEEVKKEEVPSMPLEKASIALAEVKPSLPTTFSNLFTVGPLTLPSLTAHKAQAAFQNAYYYAHDLYALIHSMEADAPKPAEAAHRILDIAIASGFCLEQIITAALLERRKVTPATYSTFFPENKHPRLQALLSSCGFNYALETDLYEELLAAVTSVEGLEIATRELPSSFTRFPLLTNAHHMLTAEVSPDKALKSLRDAIALGKDVLKAYAIILSALPSIAPHVPDNLSKQIDALPLFATMPLDALGDYSSPMSVLRESITSKLPKSFHPSTEGHADVISYTLTRLDHFYKGLFIPRTFRLSEIQARLALRNLIEEVLYLQCDLSDINIKQSVIGHDVELIAEMLGLDSALTVEERNFLASNRRLRNEARYEVEETSSRSSKKAFSASSGKGGFKVVMNDKQAKMVRRLDQELALASSIIEKAMAFSSSVKAPKSKSAKRK